MKKYLLAPSIISADFARLGEDIVKVLQAGGDLIHFDVMDNQYVSNLTIGPIILKSLRDYGITAPIDVHLMVQSVDTLIPKFAELGANYITFHPETTNHIDRTLKLIKDHGCKAGLAFNPATPLNYLEYIFNKLDIILIMSVNPGFAGQSFISSTIKKLYKVRKFIDDNNHKILLEVDGGIKINNIRKIAATGADIFVIGSAIFSKSNYKLVIDSMRYELGKINYDVH